MVNRGSPKPLLKVQVLPRLPILLFGSDSLNRKAVAVEATAIKLFGEVRVMSDSFYTRRLREMLTTNAPRGYFWYNVMDERGVWGG